MAKAFAWSFSRLKNYETCPKKFYEVDIEKHYTESTEQLDWGNRVHAALAAAIKTGAPLAPTFAPYQKWINSLRKATAGAELLVEQKFALTKDFQPCDYFSPAVWVRVIGDFIALAPPKAMILDWKTGKPQVDSKQLMLTAQCVMAYHPDVDVVDSGYVWLKHDAQTVETYHRDQMAGEWVGMLPRVQAMEAAFKTLDFPPKPGRLCGRYCPVTSCPYNGK